MIRAKIRTSTPECCIIRKHGGSLRFKHIWMGNEGIKGIIDVRSPDESRTVVVENHECSLAVEILDSGVMVISAEVERDSVVWVLICSGDAFRELITKLEELNVDYEIIYKIKFSEDEDVSYKEYEILKLAFEMGFFENPRRVKLEDIAKRLGISKSTASDLIRRALKKVVRMYLESV
ncbi:helix-turn-helix domain-containing protein [Archaeoglobus veneficus]|uniref:helix-turn-helix domain-containing protein n=1 Tax=Archaeoglobus veneficus TaxID=58290 RepID=UPI00064E7141|nr:helix-turn-helix domain-containing protein [Archaeoglobus veneficus]